ncbi:hypothetical protein COO60DRAFT_493132 [Scenedesmus sp. NREL 46B-D3]|nr:hypothetical protein COO60DRAFT_493132 [Scenedesmus sp. NREL 46B-D3]
MRRTQGLTVLRCTLQRCAAQGCRGVAAAACSQVAALKPDLVVAGKRYSDVAQWALTEVSTTRHAPALHGPVHAQGNGCDFCSRCQRHEAAAVQLAASVECAAGGSGSAGSTVSTTSTPCLFEQHGSSWLRNSSMHGIINCLAHASATLALPQPGSCQPPLLQSIKVPRHGCTPSCRTLCAPVITAPLMCQLAPLPFGSCASPTIGVTSATAWNP